MVREVIVPVDLVSEVKNIMGKVSTRQLVYLSIGGLISYRIMIYTDNPLPGLAMYAFNLFLSLPILAATAGLAFIYLGRYDMFLDKYLWYWWRARKQGKMWYYHASCGERGTE